MLINKSIRNMPIYTSQTLCKIKHFDVIYATYRFWANCVLGTVDIYMLVVAVDDGPFEAL